MRPAFLATLKGSELEGVSADWGLFALRHQKLPLLAQGGEPWRTWLILGGRGAGKTRAGAEWVRGIALGEPPYARRR